MPKIKIYNLLLKTGMKTPDQFLVKTVQRSIFTQLKHQP